MARKAMMKMLAQAMSALESKQQKRFLERKRKGACLRSSNLWSKQASLLEQAESSEEVNERTNA